MKKQFYTCLKLRKTFLSFFTLMALSGMLLQYDTTKAVAANCGPQHKEMLNTAVRINTSGSGTVLYSRQHEGKWESYILTNYHVIREQVNIKEVWDGMEGAKVKRETREPVTAFWFDYVRCSRSVGTRGRTADIVAYDQQRDLALLKLRDTERGIVYIAHLLPEDEMPKLGQTVWAVGAGLGYPPSMTSGEMAFAEQVIDGYRYQLATAPIIFGNSGGALFAYSDSRKQYEMIGVPSRVSASNFQVVTHMGWSIPTEAVYTFLRDNFHGFIVGEKYLKLENRKASSEDNKE